MIQEGRPRIDDLVVEPSLGVVQPPCLAGMKLFFVDTDKNGSLIMLVCLAEELNCNERTGLIMYALT